MTRFLTGLVTGAVMLAVSACGNPYQGKELTFGNTNSNGNCDTVTYQDRFASHSSKNILTTKYLVYSAKYPLEKK